MQIKLIDEQTHADKDPTEGGGGGDSGGGIAVSSAINGEISVIDLTLTKQVFVW